jgi:U3 small nucleolar RNA-associated protein 23
MDLIGGLERTLQAQVKPSMFFLSPTDTLLTHRVITQCSMRHLYLAAKEPGVSYLIDKAKTYERRRCNHLPEDYPEPLSAKDCLSSVVDPKDSKTNKHRYVVASQDLEVRKEMRGIMGVPLVYINRSVMIMEPMASASAETRERGERGKFREGIKAKERGSGSMKRKREEDETGEAEAKKKVRTKGPKGPNPLSVKKPKKKIAEGEMSTAATAAKEKKEVESSAVTEAQGEADGLDPTVKRKRKRKHKASAAGSESASTAAAEVADGDE